MTSMLRKAAIGAVAALTLGAGITATATPSMAHGWHGHGWHGGGWRGGGHGVYWRGGRGYGWGGGYYGGGWGGPVAAGVIGGLALGALAGSAYAYGPAYYSYGGCYWQNQPAYDAWGNFSGYQPVQVCY
jgi:hypothetical protein